MTEAKTETVAGVPVHYRGEYELSLERDYERVHTEDQHDNEHLEGLTTDSDNGTATALLAVGGARYLVAGTEALGAALTQPYTLRTTRDAEALMALLGKQIEALAGVADGIGTWLQAAHGRGELGADPAAARRSLRQVADVLRAASLPMDDIELPEDRSPGIDMDALVEGVIVELRALGVEVTEVLVFDYQTMWKLPSDRALLLSNENSWDLTVPNGRGQYTPVSFGLYCWYAHPAQIAGLVAAALSDRDAAG